MKAVQFSRFGPPEVLDLADMPTPVPGDGEALVRMKASGVNFFEVLMRADRYAVTPPLPLVPGVEVTGVVEAVGEGVDHALIGARVAVPLFAIGRAGGYAEYVAADAGALVPVPDGLSFEDATALMVQGLTALHLVRQNPVAGKNILVTAAAGGVGSLLIQLARRDGAEAIIAAAGSERKRQLALSLGADQALDYRQQGWAKAAGADIVFDLVGGEISKACMAALKQNGRLVLAAMGRFSLERADIEAMLDANQSLQGFSLLPLLTKEELARDLADIFRLAAEGELKIVRGGTFPLAAAADAHRAIESRDTAGKIVLVAEG
ncbi:quinone oxidoreductase family protein [Neorhizobium sp. DT-125]|uniref:quinone oxidoreductase family protein n=1 Tax=Neorhizobium sp. DT-125 TaxID=3396163 RepID=UPI003F1CCF13